MKEINNVLVTGVGGQGILLATDILADVFLAAGYDAKKSEVHGMAQRGGSVESHVRRNKNQVYSPLINEGEVDALVSFEPLEALRYAHMVQPNGVIIYDTRERPPLSVSLGQSTYPSNIPKRLEAFSRHVIPVPAAEFAAELGNPRVSNTILLGVLAKGMDIERDIWEQVIERRVPEKAISVNRDAFGKGYGVNFG